MNFGLGSNFDYGFCFLNHFGSSSGSGYSFQIISVWVLGLVAGGTFGIILVRVRVWVKSFEWFRSQVKRLWLLNNFSSGYGSTCWFSNCNRTKTRPNDWKLCYYLAKQKGLNRYNPIGVLDLSYSEGKIGLETSISFLKTFLLSSAQMCLLFHLKIIRTLCS